MAGLVRPIRNRHQPTLQGASRFPRELWWCALGEMPAVSRHRTKRKEPSGLCRRLWLFALQRAGGVATGRDRPLLYTFSMACRITASASSIVATVSRAISCVRSCGSSSSTVVANIAT